MEEIESLISIYGYSIYTHIPFKKQKYRRDLKYLLNEDLFNYDGIPNT